MTQAGIALYATAADIRLALARLEASQPFRYARAGMFTRPEPAVFRSFQDIPDLGVAPHPTAIANPGYLMSLPGETVVVRDVPQKTGRVLFAVDQQANVNTVHLRPGGRHEEGVILSGALGTASGSAHSAMLFGIVSKLLRQVFTPVEEHLVGPGAHAAWKAGDRLTIAVQSPPEFDLGRTTR